MNDYYDGQIRWLIDTSSRDHDVRKLLQLLKKLDIFDFGPIEAHTINMYVNRQWKGL